MGLALDGVYGPLTEAAVENFQLAHAESISSLGHNSLTGIFYLTTNRSKQHYVSTLELPIPSNLIQFRDNPQTPGELSKSRTTPIISI